MRLSRRARGNPRLLLAGFALLAALAAAGWAFRTLRLRRSTPAAPAETDWARRIPAGTLSSRPNIVLAIYDARRRDDFSLGRFGNRRGDTPFLSGFARDALLFEEAVSPGCWTVPVHASIFSGLSVCELGIDYYNPGFQSFSTRFLSLAEILARAGYRTIAYADHPFFANQDERASLLRGFEQFSVITDLARFATHTNMDAPGGRPETRYSLEGLPQMPWSVLESTVRRFNAGERPVDPERDVDHDPTTGLYFARLDALYANSEYFRRRYLDGFERHVFAQADRPFFLFLNLHMCTGVLPDPGLYSRWLLETLMANAAARGQKLSLGSEAAGVPATLLANARRLETSAGRFPHTEAFLRHVFDTRFYDATFRAVWEYLAAHGLDGNTVALVTSDHGLSLGENGEQIYAHNGARPYEYMVRVPLLMRFPRANATAALQGTRSERVSLTDLFATIVELGLGPGVFQRSLPVRGRSLVERAQRGRFDPVVVSECSLLPLPYKLRPRLIGYSTAVYQGGVKLLVVGQPVNAPDGGWPVEQRLERGTAPWSFRGSSVERPGQTLKLLFDLDEDPDERQDLSLARPEILARLERLVPPSCDPRFGAEDRASWQGAALETLKSLGYIQ